MAAKQDQIAWTVFGIFWAANAVLLVALYTTGDLPKPAVGVVVSAVGVMLSLTWWIVQRRAVAYLGYYEAIIHRIEEYLLKPPFDFALSGHLNAVLFKEKVTGLPIRWLVNGTPFLSTLLWALAVAFFLRCRAA